MVRSENAAAAFFGPKQSWSKVAGEWDRSFTHPRTVMIINLLFFLALVGVARMGEVAIRVWRTGMPDGSMTGHELYAIIAYTALLGAAGLAAAALLRLIDERF